MKKLFTILFAALMSVSMMAVKVLRDGMIYIVRDGKLFNVQGVELK